MSRSTWFTNTPGNCPVDGKAYERREVEATHELTPDGPREVIERFEHGDGRTCARETRN